MSDPRSPASRCTDSPRPCPIFGRDHNGFNLVYEPGGRQPSTGHMLRDPDRRGASWASTRAASALDYAALPLFVHYLFGKNALERERIYTDVKRALRQVARIGFAPVDIALWDLAGKFYDTPIYRLLGGYKDAAALPTPAPTMATTSRTACPARRPTPTLPSSVASWAIPRSRSTAGARRRSARRSPPSTPSASGSAAQWT